MDRDRVFSTARQRTSFSLHWAAARTRATIFSALSICLIPRKSRLSSVERGVCFIVVVGRGMGIGSVWVAKICGKGYFEKSRYCLLQGRE
jgi:hypothetical protein